VEAYLECLAAADTLLGLENYALRVFSSCGWKEEDTRDLIRRVLLENKRVGKRTFGKT
jgi:hypothetical protein